MFRDGYEGGILSELIDDNQDGFVFAHLREMDGEIHGHTFPWSEWHWQGFEEPSNFRSLNLVLLTDETSLGLLHDIVSHTSLEVVFFQ